MAQMTPIERSRQPFAMKNHTATDLVWYESPFGEHDWMEQSTAERLLSLERVKYAALGDTTLAPPRIVPRAKQLASVVKRHAPMIRKIKRESRERQLKQLKRGQPRPKPTPADPQGRRFPTYYVIDSRTESIVNVVMEHDEVDAVLGGMLDREHLRLERFPSKDQLDRYQEMTRRNNG